MKAVRVKLQGGQLDDELKLVIKRKTAADLGDNSLYVHHYE